MARRIRTGIAAAIGMLLLILDTKTALAGAKDGITLCILTVVPALLPFIFLTLLLTSSLAGICPAPLRLLGRCMRMPPGSESLFLIGALGGYPTGAQSVASVYESGQLSRRDASRLLGFCSNAGPSFLFGITAAQFSGRLEPWLLWGIHLLSAVITGILLPGGSNADSCIKPAKPITPIQALGKTVAVMAQICCWILLFRVVIAFAGRWFLWLLPPDLQVLLSGLSELTIGCTSLFAIQGTGVRFIICAGILGFGGICVMMQTVSAVGRLGLGMYVPGKLLQCLISFFLAAICQQFLYAAGDCCPIPWVFYLVFPLIIGIFALLLQKYEKRGSNLAPVAV